MSESDINITIEEVSSDINISIGDSNSDINIILDSSVPTVWGDIGGTLSNQEDLNLILSSKVDKISGKGLSTEDYTTSEKSKLEGIQSGAQVNAVNSVNLKTGNVTLSTSDIGENLNLYYTDERSRNAISEIIEGIDYNSNSGVFSLTNGYIIPTLTNFNNKVDKESGKGLSSNDFTDALKSKLDGIQSGAQVNSVNSVNGQTNIVILDTDDISEGNNKYYTDLKVDARIVTQKGTVNGIASLDETGKVPSAQLPQIGGGITYMGTWNASSGNYPTETPNDGEFWVISIAGTIATISYSLGDWIIYNSTGGWSKVPSGSAVSSVNSKTGNIVLTTTDIAQGINEYYTESKVNNNIEVQKGVTAYGWGNHASGGYALDSGVVHNIGDETIYGNKTFDDTLYINDRLNVGSNTFDTVNPEFLKVDGGTSSSVNIISGYSNYDDYVQLNIKNSNDGIYASSDFVATADTGQEGANYIDVGINNSNYASPEFNIVKALDGYVFVDGGDLALGTSTPTKELKLFTGGTLEENLRATVSDSGLNVVGDISATNFSGSSSGTNTGDQDLSNYVTIEHLLQAKNFAIAMAVVL